MCAVTEAVELSRGPTTQSGEMSEQERSNPSPQTGGSTPHPTDDPFSGLKRLEHRSDPLAGLRELGDHIERAPSRRRAHGSRSRTRRRRWKAIIITGITIAVVGAGLVAGEYGYVQWKLSQIKSVKCRSCRSAAPGKAFNVLVVGSD